VLNEVPRFQDAAAGQVYARPMRGALPRSVHDKKAEWIWGVLAELEAADLITLADKGLPGNDVREDHVQGEGKARVPETGQ
jgi:hypothetical protein